MNSAAAILIEQVAQADTLHNLEVTQVTSVQANNDAVLDVTPGESEKVTGVTGPIPTKASDCPAFRVVPNYTKLEDGTSITSGLWHFEADLESNINRMWVSSPVYVDAVTFDGQDNNFGRTLRFKNTNNRWREWAMPMLLLRGSGDDLRGELLSMGVELNPSSKARNLFATYIQSQHPKRRMRCATQTGWCDGSYVLPDDVIGDGASEVIFQSGESGHDEFTIGGTRDGWQNGVARRAIGNPLLLLAVSSAFSGPLLSLCHAEGGGLHYYGDSSTGKTTLLEAAASVWGGRNYRRSWRATANGIEGAASKFNDGLLVLDEISECDPKQIGEIVYSLGNGRGKQRASRSGAARSVARWLCAVVSSGERTIETAMFEGGFRAKAGQSVRMIDIPAQRKFGAWDQLQDLPSGTAFSDAIKLAATTHHGHAGRAYLERLTRDKRDFCAALETAKSLPMFAADGSEGQDRRVAGRLALIGVAGELATGYGITGWPEGAAMEAAAVCFRLWQAARGKGNDERRQVLERIAGFIDRHGDSRFSDVSDGNAQHVRDRAGWWENDGDGGRRYLFTSDGLKEALKGFDFKRTLDALVQQGVLRIPGADGKKSVVVRIGGATKRLYPIDPSTLGDEHVA